jgi:hypothetical protein
MDQILRTMAREDFSVEKRVARWQKMIAYLMSNLASLVESLISSFHIRMSESLVLIFECLNLYLSHSNL